jgi:hypothetical protein
VTETPFRRRWRLGCKKPPRKSARGEAFSCLSQAGILFSTKRRRRSKQAPKILQTLFKHITSKSERES